jgi:hypothetical protein
MTMFLAEETSKALRYKPHVAIKKQRERERVEHGEVRLPVNLEMFSGLDQEEPWWS